MSRRIRPYGHTFNRAPPPEDSVCYSVVFLRWLAVSVLALFSSWSEIMDPKNVFGLIILRYRFSQYFPFRLLRFYFFLNFFLKHSFYDFFYNFWGVANSIFSVISDFLITVTLQLLFVPSRCSS